MATAQYEVMISVSGNTLQSLQTGGFSLCVLKAISTTAGGGQPVLSWVTTRFAMNIGIGWTSSYEAYASLTAGAIIQTLSGAIDYGQFLEIQSGGLTVTSGGPADAMSILNQTTTQYTCGLQAQWGEQFSPVAVPLYGNMMASFAPIEQVLLLFTTYPAMQGQPFTRSYSQGLLVNGTAGARLNVNFDVNSGWSWGGGSWAQIVPPNTLLTPLLIHSTPLVMSTEGA